MPDLELASYEDIVAELGRRNPLVILITLRSLKLGPEIQSVLTIHGNIFAALGLMHDSTVALQQKMLVMRAMQAKKAEEEQEEA